MTRNIYSPASLTTRQLAYPQPGRDRLRAEGRRLLVIRMTQPHANQCYRSAVVNWCQGL